MKVLSVITCLVAISSVLSWGPFPSCGQTDPKDLNDCDAYSLRTGLGCCLAELQGTPKMNKCILVGGKAQGFFNNATLPISLSNLTFPQSVANRTLESSRNYTEMINKTYGSQPNAIIKCAKNNALALKLTSFLAILLLMLFV